MKAFRLVVGFVLVVGLASCGDSGDDIDTTAGTSIAMPDVVGRQLDAALSDIEGAGFEDEVEVLGGGTFGVVDESNWQVCEQSPAAGEAVEDAPQLTVDRSCGGDDPQATPSEQPSAEEPAEDPAEVESEESGGNEILTAETSGDLAALLAEPANCLSPANVGFATKYQGRTIAFDGNIAALAPNGDYDTRYDFLIYVGDYNETTASGPSFKFEDVNISELGLTGSNIPDEVRQGDHVRIVAKVEEYNPETCLIFLDPVSTELR